MPATKYCFSTPLVTSSLLHNCETFGPDLPKGIEVLYFKLIKSALNVRPSTPNKIVLVESGMLPIRALVNKRQLKFYRAIMQNMGANSVRRIVFDLLHQPENVTSYMKHYISLDVKYENPNEIYTEAMRNVKSEICTKALNSDKHYKFYIYKQINPDVLPSPFLSCPNADAITRFRCGSHHLPIETMRWGRVPREDRRCGRCHVLGDEFHYIFHCIDFHVFFSDCNNDLSLIWKHKDLFTYFKKLSQSDYLKNY